MPNIHSIAIASDHAGYSLKEMLCDYLKENDYEIEEKSIVDKGLIEEFQNKFNQTLRTVPQVVIDGDLVGGFAETENFLKGPLSINKI